MTAELKLYKKQNTYLNILLAIIVKSCYYKARTNRTYVRFVKEVLFMFTQNSNYERIAAIIPSYTATGDTTTIIDTNGSKRANNTRIHTVLQRLARSRATDLIALKRNAAGVTDRTILQPLSLAPGLVLCPLKVRIPRVSGDTSIGYINFHAVTSVSANHNKPYQSTIKLTGGTELPVLWTPGTVKKHLQYARLAMSYTAHESAMRPELTMIAQKQVEVMYDLLVFQLQLIRQSPDPDVTTILP